MKIRSPFILLILLTLESHGAYSFTGPAISENFNGIPTTTVTNVFSNTAGTQTVISGTSTGFSGAKLAGTSSGSPGSSFIVDNGVGTSGAIYSYGATSGADRALGTVASGTNVMGFGFEIVNSSPTLIITEITASFTQENWRSSTVTTNTFAASYTTGAAASTTYLTATTGFTAAGALSLIGPTFGSSNGALDGNLAANQTARTLTITGLSIAPAASFYLRWQDVNDAGNDAALAIDDLIISFVTIPEPNIAALLSGLGVISLLRRRR